MKDGRSECEGGRGFRGSIGSIPYLGILFFIFSLRIQMHVQCGVG